MQLQTCRLMSPELAILVVLIFLLAGTVKGLVGMGLPLTALALLTFFVDPRTAISLVMIPMVVTNAWQVWRSGKSVATFLRYLPFIAALMVSVGVSVFAFAGVGARGIFAGLGVILLLFVAVNARRFSITLPDRFDRVGQILAGLASGITGGLTSVWAPPMAMYLVARQVSKDEFVRASGMLIFMGSLPMVASYVNLGFLDRTTALWGVGILVPACLGFWIGERLRAQLSETGFRKVLLVVFVIIGLNLIRRAIWGG